MDGRRKKLAKETHCEALTIFPLRGEGRCEYRTSRGSCGKGIDSVASFLYIKISLSPGNGSEHLRF